MTAPISPPDLAELIETIDGSPTLAAIRKALNRLPISADAKAITLKIAEVAVSVGQTVLRIGRAIVGFALDLAKKFPNTAFMLVMAILVTTLVAMVPFVGPFLASVVGPLVGAVAAFLGMINDRRLLDLRTREGLLNAREALLGRVEAAEKSGLLDRIEAFERRFERAEAVVIDLGGAKDVV